MDPPRPLVGRTAEQAHLRGALDRAVAGEPTATLLHGEPGIGKTTLLRDMVDQATARGFHVLFGQCLRFGAEVTTHLPFTQAFDRWARGVGSETVDRVFPGAASGRGSPHSLGHTLGLAAETGSQGMLFRLSGAVDQLADDGPTLVVVDDLQWADPSSLDVLSFIVAGLHRSQHLVLALAYRDTELGDGHPLHSWLADLRRVKGIARFQLSRLSFSETEQLVVGLSGVPFDLAMSERVFARSEGNPYLSELMAEGGGDADGRQGGLAQALLASWHRLGPTARAVTQLVSVAGRPVAFRVLQDLAVRRGLAGEDVAAAVSESVGEGITILQGHGDVWFRHPLLAEVIVTTLLPWQLPEVHRAFAAVWEEAEDVSDDERATHLALHYRAAGDAEPAFRWALRAADAALRLRAISEEATHLATAAELVEAVPAEARPATPELLTRAGRCLIAAGRPALALELYARALSAVDPQEEPLRACRVLMALNFALGTNVTGTASASVSDFQRAVALTELFPHSRERVLALAHLANFEVFEGIDSGMHHAEEAVRLAEELGEDDALAWALVVRAQTRWGTRAGVVDAERAWARARAVDDTELLIRVSVNVCNSYESVGQLAASAALSREVHALMRERGSAQGISCTGARAALTLVQLGRWDEARSVIRETLALRLDTRWGAAARCGAAVLSALEGDVAAAEAHLSRAKELMPVSSMGDEFNLCEMIVAIELGRPRRALELVERWMTPWVALDPAAADQLLQLAARAAADLAEGAEGASDAPGPTAIAWLQRIVSLRGDSPPRYVPSGPDDALHPAWGALFAADRARCHAEDRMMVPLWQAAAEATHDAGLRLEHARSLYLLGRSLLGEPKGREQAADALGRAMAVAKELGAAPVVALIEQLALQAHLVVLTPDVGEPSGDGSRDVLAGVTLTRREAEVLDHLVAGETYAQVARRLFISEKTVSSHVSSLLRKTGTTSRIALAALAVQSRSTPSDRLDRAT
ncbi:helix-turn-helix transcriptional regulator [Phycicoccus sp. Soil803]|uniref:helix-turn-helix transcriptional regulator n=1 Tax=Phycicoccus sp. Soil803 TaxID=1736415 RepID=UPI0009EB509C|nr:LuxR family transcriptional regulator [Phycicoccus sp. Soil803]